MSGRLAMPRSRGGISGTLLLLAGIWGAAIPFFGPFVSWVIGPNDAFNMTDGRFWLSLVPGLIVIAGALILIRAGNRATGSLGAQLALAGGVWFALGPIASRFFNDGQSLLEPALGGPNKQALEQLTYYEGLGVLIVALAAFALGRMTLRGDRDADRLGEHGATGEHRPTGRFTRRRARDGEGEAETAPRGERPVR